VRGATPTIREEDVSATALKKVNIDEVLMAITVYESNLEEKLTVQMVESLMGYY